MYCPQVVIIDMAQARPTSCQGKVQVFCLSEPREQAGGPDSSAAEKTVHRLGTTCMMRRGCREPYPASVHGASHERIFLIPGKTSRLGRLGWPGCGLAVLLVHTGESETLLELLAASLGLGHSSLLARLLLLYLSRRRNSARQH